LPEGLRKDGTFLLLVFWSIFWAQLLLPASNEWFLCQRLQLTASTGNLKPEKGVRRTSQADGSCLVSTVKAMQGLFFRNISTKSFSTAK
jgi:hypothetical protein